MVAIQAPAPAQPIQSLGEQFVAHASLQPNTSVRRNQIQSIELYRGIGYSHNGPVGTFIPSPQNQFTIPIADKVAPSWFGAEIVYMNPQFAAQNLGNHGTLAVMGPQSAGEMQYPGDHQLAHVEPKTMGQPPVWADKRQALCESTPYYQAYQSGAYHVHGIALSMMIDAESRRNDIFDPEIVITRW